MPNLLSWCPTNILTSSIAQIISENPKIHKALVFICLFNSFLAFSVSNGIFFQLNVFSERVSRSSAVGSFNWLSIIIFSDQHRISKALRTNQWIYNSGKCGLDNFKYFFLWMKMTLSNPPALLRNTFPFFLRSQIGKPEWIGTALTGTYWVNFAHVFIKETPSIRMFPDTITVFERI